MTCGRARALSGLASAPVGARIATFFSTGSSTAPSSASFASKRAPYVMDAFAPFVPVPVASFSSSGACASDAARFAFRARNSASFLRPLVRSRARASSPTAGMTRERVRDGGWDWGDVLKNTDSRDARRRRDARGDPGMDGA